MEHSDGKMAFDPNSIMSKIKLKFPDGSEQEFPKGITPVEVAKSISGRSTAGSWTCSRRSKAIPALSF